MMVCSVFNSFSEITYCFTRDVATAAQSLVRDFGLKEHDLRERNLNRFMAYIGESICLRVLISLIHFCTYLGIPFHLIPVPGMPDA